MIRPQNVHRHSARQCSARDGRHRQAGAYAVEYALVFPVLFLLLYAVISYGIIFTMRLSLQHAAEEGARAALRYETSGTTRLANAAARANLFLDWMPAGGLTITRQICQRNAPDACWNGTGSPPDCRSSLVTLTCSVEVRVEYNYAANPIAPPIPGLGLIMPNVLTGKASVLMERVTL